MQVLGEVVNTLFVDFASLSQVWLLLIAVQRSSAVALRFLRASSKSSSQQGSSSNSKKDKATLTSKKSGMSSTYFTYCRR
ncbi:unnamed protein product [Amoebophrya sp. A25]|nr:unnamed protein product [Amoebophrya sp. A25]|eukprot:GSA25T00023920001.1